MVRLFLMLQRRRGDSGLLAGRVCLRPAEEAAFEVVVLMGVVLVGLVGLVVEVGVVVRLILVVSVARAGNWSGIS